MFFKVYITAFYGETASPVNEERDVGIIYLDFSKTFGKLVSCSFLVN